MTRLIVLLQSFYLWAVQIWTVLGREREKERENERERKKEKDMGSVKFGHQWREVVVGKRGGVGCMYICLSGGLNITRIYGFMQCYF